MSSAREEIIARIRRAAPPESSSQSDAYEEIRRDYQQVGRLDNKQRLDLFAERLRDYGATVYECSEDQIANTVAEAMTRRERKSLVVPPDMPAAWLPNALLFKPGEQLSYEELDAADGVLTSCAAAIAMTGTIILEHSAGQGRRAMTLIPDYHLCIVFSNQVVETVSEAIGKLGTASRFPLTTISGPSATADIEMTRVKGVHGPRHLDVIVVQV